MGRRCQSCINVQVDTLATDRVNVPRNEQVWHDPSLQHAVFLPDWTCANFFSAKLFCKYEMSFLSLRWRQWHGLLFWGCYSHFLYIHVDICSCWNDRTNPRAFETSSNLRTFFRDELYMSNLKYHHHPWYLKLNATCVIPVGFVNRFHMILMFLQQVTIAHERHEQRGYLVSFCFRLRAFVTSSLYVCKHPKILLA